MVSVLYQAALRVWGGRSDLFSQTMSCYTTQTRMIATRLGWMQKEKSRFWSQIKCKQATNGCDVHNLFFDTDTEIRGGCHHQQTEETNHTLFHAVTLSSTVPPVWPPCAWTVRGTVTFTSYCTVSICEDCFWINSSQSAGMRNIRRSTEPCSWWTAQSTKRRRCAIKPPIRESRTGAGRRPVWRPRPHPQRLKWSQVQVWQMHAWQEWMKKRYITQSSAQNALLKWQCMIKMRCIISSTS